MAYLTGVSVLIADAAMIFCAYVFITIRLWFRLIHQKVSITISDIFILVAAAELLILMMIFVKENEMGVIMKNPRQTSQLRKLALGTVILYDTSLYFLKFSILWLYHVIFPIAPSKLRVTLYVTAAVTVVCFFTAIFMAIFWCGTDVNEHWRFQEEGTTKCSFWNTQLFMADWVMNIVTDVVILVLPFPLLKKVALSRRQVVALCVTFGLGGITMVVSIFRFVSVLHHEFLPLYVWSVAEICTGIVVVSLPALRPLLKRAKSSNMLQKSPQSMQMQRLSPQRLNHDGTFLKSDHRSRGGDQLDGYHFAYDAEKAGSDVELHGRLRSEVQSNAETIAVYVEPGEVLDRPSPSYLTPSTSHSPSIYPNATQPSQATKDWVQRTRLQP